MRAFEVDKFLIRLMNHSDIEEVKKVQSLRYLHLMKEYNPSLPDGGIDDDGYDEVSDSILVIDKTSGMIAGTYRIATLSTIKNKKFLMEEEYNIDCFRGDKDGFLELGRAVVHPLYRNGFVIELLFLAIYRYMCEHGLRYTVGLSSFHGTDPSIYAQGLALLKRDYSFEKYQIKAISNSFPLDYIKEEDIDLNEAKHQLSGLLRMYLRLGNRVAYNGSIDYSFNSSDVLIVLDIKNISERYMNHFSRLVVKEL